MTKRAHVYMHWDTLVQALGLQGHAIKVYSEQDNDYVHIFLESDDPDLTWEDDGFLFYGGGYVEAKALHQVVKDPDILRRLGRSETVEATTDATSV